VEAANIPLPLAEDDTGGSGSKSGGGMMSPLGPL
jgi:hypothetical protein